MARQLVVALIRMYQRVSQLTPPVCRFQPTCSEYAVQAILRYGVVRGLAMALKRIIKCHPWNQGGYDPVK